MVQTYELPVYTDDQWDNLSRPIYITKGFILMKVDLFLLNYPEKGNLKFDNEGRPVKLEEYDILVVRIFPQRYERPYNRD